LDDKRKSFVWAGVVLKGKVLLLDWRVLQLIEAFYVRRRFKSQTLERCKYLVHSIANSQHPSLSSLIQKNNEISLIIHNIRHGKFHRPLHIS